MLSIIVSSYNSEYFSNFEKNVCQTCGTPYEIIKIDNPGKMGIGEAYNLGASKAKYENLLFVHEDVTFDSLNWGRILTEKYLSLEKVGVVGIAGAIRKFHSPTGVVSLLPDETFVFIDQKGLPKILKKHPQRPISVKVTDGVFLAMKKYVWEDIKFDETLPRFHFYDIDFTLRTSEKYTNYLISEIDMTHFSMGNFGNEWINAAILFNKLSKYNYDRVSPAEIKHIRKKWFQRLTYEDISFINRLRYIFCFGFDRYSRRAMQEFLFKKYFVK